MRYIQLLILISLLAPPAIAQVFNGQAINATVTNNAFWKRSVNDTATGEYALQSPLTADGAFVNNIQRSINACDSYTGLPANSAYNALPTWAYTDVGSPTDTLKTRADALGYKFNDTAGHMHTGSPGDAPQLTDSSFSPTAGIARTKIAASTPYAVVLDDSSGFPTGTVAPCSNGYVLQVASGVWSCQPFSGGGGGVVEFKVWGHLNGLVNDFGEPHYWIEALTLTSVTAAMEDCGATGSTTFNVNQWRGGTIIDTATGSLAATGGQCGAQITLSHSQSIAIGDTTTVDLTGLPTGTPKNLTLGIDSGSIAGPAGPAGPPGNSNVYVVTKGSNYTASVSTDNVILVDATAGNVNITLPLASAMYSSLKTVVFTIKKIDSSIHVVNILPSGSDTIDGTSSKVLNTQFQSLDIFSSGGNLYVK